MRIEGFQLRLLTIEGRDRFDELCGCHLGEPTNTRFWVESLGAYSRVTFFEWYIKTYNIDIYVYNIYWFKPGGSRLIQIKMHKLLLLWHSRLLPPLQSFGPLPRTRPCKAQRWASQRPWEWRFSNLVCKPKPQAQASAVTKVVLTGFS